MILRLRSGRIAGARLRRRSEPVREGVWTVLVRRAGEAIGLRVLPALRWSQEVAVPVVVGFAKPAVLLPVALASRLSVEQVEAVLAHELAHLRRRDLWAVAVQRAVETVLFFHPAVWWMSRVMERSREEACDDLVAARLESVRMAGHERVEDEHAVSHFFDDLQAGLRGHDAFRRAGGRLTGDSGDRPRSANAPHPAPVPVDDSRIWVRSANSSQCLGNRRLPIL